MLLYDEGTLIYKPCILFARMLEMEEENRETIAQLAGR